MEKSPATGRFAGSITLKQEVIRWSKQEVTARYRDAMKEVGDCHEKELSHTSAVRDNSRWDRRSQNEIRA